MIFDDRHRFPAIGLCDPTSPIRVRVLQHAAPAPIDRDWLAARLAAAAAARASLPKSGITGYRPVHSENDSPPGLVVDRNEDTQVPKLYTAAWVPHLADLCAALMGGFPKNQDADLPGLPDSGACMDAGVAHGTRNNSIMWLVLRLSRELTRRPEYLYGLGDGMTLAGTAPQGPVTFSENGLRFEADVVHGQKTGFFFDQRDNRARVVWLATGTGCDVWAVGSRNNCAATRVGCKPWMGCPHLFSVLKNHAPRCDHCLSWQAVVWLSVLPDLTPGPL